MAVMSTPRRAEAWRQRSFAGNARFELKQVLGAGGMGVVYEAFDREREMTVALKVVHELDAHGLYRLKTEFRARADLEHRNLVRLGELFEDDGHWFFTMELVEGWTFVEWVRAAVIGVPRQDARRALAARLREAVRQLAAGLEVLHRAGMVHRDLKPSNVLVTAKGRVVILDFGLVGNAAPGLRSAGQDVVGTAAYMAPEQARTPSVGPAADLYSVGVMMYEALTGELPFDGAPLEMLMRKQQEDPPTAGARPTRRAVRALLESQPRTSGRQRRGSSRSSRRARRPRSASRRSSDARRELGLLDAALDEVARGAAITMFVEGESGIGKSALVRSFLGRVESTRRGPLDPVGPVLRARVACRSRASTASSIRSRTSCCAAIRSMSHCCSPRRSRRSRACSRCCVACLRSRGCASPRRRRPSSCGRARFAGCVR